MIVGLYRPIGSFDQACTLTQQTTHGPPAEWSICDLPTTCVQVNQGQLLIFLTNRFDDSLLGLVRAHVINEASIVTPWLILVGLYPLWQYSYPFAYLLWQN